MDERPSEYAVLRIAPQFHYPTPLLANRPNLCQLGRMKLLDDIKRTCIDHGLAVDEVVIEGDIAIITPTSLDALVDAETLAGIAEDVRQFGIKHVALDLKT